MLNKEHRFHGYGSVRAVYAKGQAARGGPLGLKYVKGNPGRPFRAAVVVSRKVHKSAVTRNRIRRRVYEALRTTPVQPLPGSDLVFTVFSEQLADMPPEKLQTIVADLIHKTNQT